MACLYEAFPCLHDRGLLLAKMQETDLGQLHKITSDPEIYRFIPPFLYNKSKGNLLAAIRNLGGRDFDKRKKLVLGVYLDSEPGKLIALAQVFDYRKRSKSVTIGYMVERSHWSRGIATSIIALLKDYLLTLEDILVLEAYVLRSNDHSFKALEANDFIRLDEDARVEGWGFDGETAAYHYQL